MKLDIIQGYNDDDSSSQRGTDVLIQNATPSWSGINVRMVTYRLQAQQVESSIVNHAGDSFLNNMAESSTNLLQRQGGLIPNI